MALVTGPFLGRIASKEYPLETSDNEKRMLRRLAADFFVSGSILYKRNHDMVLLRCVNAKEAKNMLGVVHIVGRVP